MRAVQLADSIQPPVLIQAETPQPRPGRGELLIRVCAAGFISTELSWYPTSHRKSGEARVRAVPAHEFSGVVAAVGEEVGSLEIGHEVYGALTAWQKLQPGERVLVYGGAGTVGVFAVQLARLHGDHVIATASARNRDFVSSLEPNQKQLAEVAVLLDSEQIRTVVDAVRSQALEAYAGRIARQGRGKLVVAVANMN